MKLHKVISGGQTGADRAGLECAKELGLETGGTAPSNYYTEDGPDISLKDFGLVTGGDYRSRTRQNVYDADATLWFGNTSSPGYKCTAGAAKDFGRPFFVNAGVSTLYHIATEFKVINIAGNRASKNPRVMDLVREAFASLKEYID